MLPDGSDNPSLISLQGHQFTDAGLKTLRLFGTGVTDDGVKQLRRALPKTSIYYREFMERERTFD